MFKLNATVRVTRLSPEYADLLARLRTDLVPIEAHMGDKYLEVDRVNVWVQRAGGNEIFGVVEHKVPLKSFVTYEALLDYLILNRQF